MEKPTGFWIVLLCCGSYFSSVDANLCNKNKEEFVIDANGKQHKSEDLLLSIFENSEKQKEQKALDPLFDKIVEFQRKIDQFETILKNERNLEDSRTKDIESTLAKILSKLEENHVIEIPGALETMSALSKNVEDLHQKTQSLMDKHETLKSNNEASFSKIEENISNFQQTEEVKLKNLESSVSKSLEGFNDNQKKLSEISQQIITATSSVHETAILDFMENRSNQTLTKIEEIKNDLLEHSEKALIKDLSKKVENLLQKTQTLMDQPETLETNNEASLSKNEEIISNFQQTEKGKLSALESSISQYLEGIAGGINDIKSKLSEIPQPTISGNSSVVYENPFESVVETISKKTLAKIEEIKTDLLLDSQRVLFTTTSRNRDQFKKLGDSMEEVTTNLANSVEENKKLLGVIELAVIDKTKTVVPMWKIENALKKAVTKLEEVINERFDNVDTTLFQNRVEFARNSRSIINKTGIKAIEDDLILVKEDLKKILTLIKEDFN